MYYDDHGLVGKLLDAMWHICIGDSVKYDDIYLYASHVKVCNILAGHVRL